jgi:disulfide bond formation protein DsbB
MKKIVVLFVLALLLITGAVYAGKVYTLSSAVTGAVTGTAVAPDDYYKDWDFSAYCSGTMNAAVPPTVTIERTIDGTHYDTYLTHPWTTTEVAAGHTAFSQAAIPIRKFRSRWSSIYWTTTGSCGMQGLGVN